MSVTISYPSTQFEELYGPFVNLGVHLPPKDNSPYFKPCILIRVSNMGLLIYVLFGFSDNWILDLDLCIKLGLDYNILNLGLIGFILF